MPQMIAQREANLFMLTDQKEFFVFNHDKDSPSWVEGCA